MDKQLLKAYIRTIVEEEVKRILPELLSEAVREVKQISESQSFTTKPPAKPAMDRSKLAQLMGISYDGDTLRASTKGLQPETLTTMDSAGNKVQIPVSQADPEVVKAITKDYSALMKKMGLT